MDGHFSLIVNHLIRDDNYPVHVHQSHVFYELKINLILLLFSQNKVDLKTQFGELMIMVNQLNEENNYLKKCMKKFKNEIDQLKSENKMMNEKINNVKLNHQVEIDSLRRDHDIMRNELKVCIIEGIIFKLTISSFYDYTFYDVNIDMFFFNDYRIFQNLYSKKGQSR